MDNYLRHNCSFTKDPILTQANLTLKDSFDNCQKTRPYQTKSSLQFNLTNNLHQFQHQNSNSSIGTLSIQNSINNTFFINDPINLNNNLDQHNSWIEEPDLCQQEISIFNFSEILGDLSCSGQKITGADQDLSDTSSEIDSASSSNFGIHSNHEWGRSSGYASEVSNTDEVEVNFVSDDHQDYFERRRQRILERERQKLREKSKIDSGLHSKQTPFQRRNHRTSHGDDAYNKDAFIYYNDWSDNEEDEEDGHETDSSEIDSESVIDIDRVKGVTFNSGIKRGYEFKSKRQNSSGLANGNSVKSDSNDQHVYVQRKNNSNQKIDLSPLDNNQSRTPDQDISGDQYCMSKTRCLKRDYDPVDESSIAGTIKKRSRLNKIPDQQSKPLNNMPATRASSMGDKSLDKPRLYNSQNSIQNSDLFQTKQYPTSGNGFGKPEDAPALANFKMDSSQNDGRRRHLLHFIIELLNKRHNCVEWVNKCDRIFQISNPNELTRLWGQYKKNTKMTFESLSRSLRLYYAPKKLERIQGRRHQYRLLYVPSKSANKLISETTSQLKNAFNSPASSLSPGHSQNEKVSFNNFLSNQAYSNAASTTRTLPGDQKNCNQNPEFDQMSNHSQFNRSKVKWY